MLKFKYHIDHISANHSIFLLQITVLLHSFTYSLSDKISILFSIYNPPESFIFKQQIQDINYERYGAPYALITSRDRTAESGAWLWRQKDNMKKPWDWVNYLITFVRVALSVRLGCIDRKHTSLFFFKKKSQSSVCHLGNTNTFNALSSITLNLFSIPGWGRKYIFDWFLWKEKKIKKKIHFM